MSADAVVEGGSPVTATVTASSDSTIPEGLEIELAWCGEPLLGESVGADPRLLRGQGDDPTTIAMSGGSTTSTGTLTIEALVDHANGATAVYYPPRRCPLTATFAGAQQSVPLTRTDAAGVPEARFGTAAAEVVEGENIEVEAVLAPAYGYESLEVKLEVTDADSVVDLATLPVVLELTNATSTDPALRTHNNPGYLPTKGNSTADGARTVILRLVAGTDGRYSVGTPSSVTVTVLDDDVAPAAPVPFTGAGSNDRITLSWTPPVQVVTGYEYRYKATGTTTWGPSTVPADDGWEAVPDSAAGGANRTSFTVENLTVGESYDFELRGRNDHGAGAAASDMFSTIVITSWNLSVSGDTIVEGGSPITATVTATSDSTIPEGLEVELAWCGDPLGGDSRLRGQGDEPTTITMSGGSTTSTGTLTIEAPADHAGGATAVYYPPETCELTATFAGEEKSVTLTRTDAAGLPVARFGTATAEVVEGENIEVEAFLTPAYGPDSLLVTLEVTDADDVLPDDDTPEHLQFFQFKNATSTAPTSAIHGHDGFLLTVENTTADGARTVTLRLVENADVPYSVGTPPSVTVTVLDDDVAPAAPIPFTGAGSNDRITLSWTPPVQVVTGYEYRYKATGTTAWGPSAVPADNGWEAVPDSAAGGANRTSFTVENLTVGQSYDFEVRGRNDVGAGTAASEIFSTIVINSWNLSVSGDTIVEGGSPTTATVIARSDTNLPEGLEVGLTWCGEPLGGDSLLRGQGDEPTTIAMSGGSTTSAGSLVIEAPADASEAVVYHPPETCSLTATFAGTEESVDLTRTDAQSVPVATIRAEPEALPEGGSTDVTVTLTPPLGGDGGDVLLEVEDADSALAAAPATALTFADGIGERTFTVATVDNTARPADRGIRPPWSSSGCW